MSRRSKDGKPYQPKLFKPGSPEPFKLSRSRLEGFVRCPRCFILDVRHGVKRPEGYSLALNIATDVLLKREFDIYRQAGQPHPTIVAAGLNAIPWKHAQLEDWRNNFVGMQCLMSNFNLIITGAPDDLWLIGGRYLATPDYKSTAKESAHPSTSPYWASFERQIDFHHWLLSKMDIGEYEVATTGYIYLVNGDRKAPRFDNCIKFSAEIIPHPVDVSWIEPMIENAFNCMNNATLPKSSPECEHCEYRTKAFAIEYP